MTTRRPAPTRTRTKVQSSRSTRSRASAKPASKKPDPKKDAKASTSRSTSAVRQKESSRRRVANKKSVSSNEHHDRVWNVGSTRRRFRWMAGVALALLVSLMGKSAYIQVAHGSGLQADGVAQRESTTKIQAARGTIFDRDGNEMAVTLPALSLYADPRAVTDPAATAHLLGQMLGFDASAETELANKLAKKATSFVYVQRFVNQDVADAILSLNLAGVNGISEPERIQVAGGLATNIIGRTDPFGVGSTGLELQYDKVLSGHDGSMVRELLKGRSLPGTSRIVEQARPGTDLVLTIDRSMQFQTGGNAVILDTKTGEVLAIASVRRDSNGIAEVTSANLAAVESYEPGSVAKVFSIAATIDTGVGTPESVYEVPGVYIFDPDTKFEKTIYDAYPHELEPMSLRDIIVHSSNIGTLMAASEVGSPKLRDYLSEFGFGHQTGLEFPGESAGVLKEAKNWRGSENATVSYGYGFSSTSLQLAAAVNVVANRGVYVSPKFVKSTIDEKGSLWETPSGQTHRVISEATASTMTDLLAGVVCEGTGVRAQVDGIAVAGKTGTSRKIQANGTYISDSGLRSYFATFVGFLPAADPQVTILVSIDEPDPSSRDRFGGTAAAPAFAKLATMAIHERSIDPTIGDNGCRVTK
ncbi:MAG: penicillin-binding protein 2 [Actinobacteria bacterium]|nr:penicillin-binding protein 2 [Actinomycetota bacterium]